MNFDEIFFQFAIGDMVVLFPKDRFDENKIKTGEQKFDVKKTSKGAFIAIPQVEKLKLKFQPTIYK
jgi:hypothetical protein